MAKEINFDGIVGPTHNYGGLSHGNIASEVHGGRGSHPREAALQGLAKMKALFDLGIPQAVLPPHERPLIGVLREAGYRGHDPDVLWRVGRENPLLLNACSSASAMWAANAATVSPSSDTCDGKVHFTPANLMSTFHRSLEVSTTSEILKAIFRDEKYFSHHAALPPGSFFSDEGAANHSRFCPAYGKKGVHFFVYGFSAGSYAGRRRGKYFPRQSREASEAVARLNQLNAESVVFAKQSSRAIQSGAFHNDVIFVGDRNLLLFHEEAFYAQKNVMRTLERRYFEQNGEPLIVVSVPPARLTLEEAVQSYLFNSQLVTLPDGARLLVAPEECRESASAVSLLNEIQQRTKGALSKIVFFNLRESMWNGGGPACLRLRVVLTEAERAGVSGRIFLTESLYSELVDWVTRNYREVLIPKELADPKLLEESRRALDELTVILELGSIYSFQKSCPAACRA